MAERYDHSHNLAIHEAIVHSYRALINRLQAKQPFTDWDMAHKMEKTRLD